jgi:hypothetical protein
MTGMTPTQLRRVGPEELIAMLMRRMVR